MVRIHSSSLLTLILFSSSLLACGLTSEVPGSTASETPATEEAANDNNSSSSTDDSSTTGNDSTNPGDTNNNGGGNTDPGPIDSNCPEAEHFLDVTQFEGAGAAYPDPELNVYCTDTTLVIESNGIPHYEFQQITPNALGAQNYNFQIPRNPVVANATSAIALLGPIGVAVNGIPLFGPNEAAQPNPYGDPVYNNILDYCLGHTAAQGVYHYHAMLVQCLSYLGGDNEPDTSEPSPIIGWALDGFPIYGPLGCTDDPCTEVVEFKSGWNQTGDPSTYAWDNHEFVTRPNDATYLDECNGRTGPDGTYRYHATATFPYILGCFSGTESANGGGGNDGGQNNGDTGGPGGGGTGGPPTCVEESDCVNQCPSGSIGCTCHETPNGNKLCVPECSSDSDCPEGPMGQLMCNTAQGVCVPQGGPGGQP